MIVNKSSNKKNMGIITSIVMSILVSSASASNGISALYEKYSPAKQFPLQEVCHTPTLIPLIGQSEGKGTNQKSSSKKTYVRSEHQYRSPELPVVTMDGIETSLADILDSEQPVMLNFIFTTCTTICPVLSATFTQLQEQLGPETQNVKMVSITIDPEYDTPAKLQDYARRFNAGPQWEFLTGDTADIIAIEKAFDAYRGAKMSHEPLTFIRIKGDDSWVRLEGIASADDIMKEYKQLVSK